MRMFRRIAIHTIISFGARIIGVVLGFFSLGLTTRLLGAQGFGLYSTALTWAYLVSFLADLGLYSLLVREVSRVKEHEEREVVSHIFTLRLVSLLLFLGIALITAWWYPDAFGVSLLALTLASVQYFFLSLSQVLMGVFQKHLKMEWVALAEIVGRSVSVLGLLYLFYYAPQAAHYEMILLVFNVGSGILLCINIASAQKFIPFTLAFSAPYWKSLLRQASPIALSIILTTLYFKLDTLFIGYFRNQHEVGLYNAAYRLLENLIAFPAMFVGVLMPQLSQSALTDKSTFIRMFQGAFEVIAIIAFPLMVGIWWESGDIIALIAGPEFAASSRVLVILGVAMGMIYLGSLFSNALIALNMQRSLAWIYFWGAAFNITANIVVVPIWGFIGAGVTTLLTEALVSILMARHLEATLLTRLRFGRFTSIIIASIALALFLQFTTLPIVWSILLGVAIYGLVLVATGGISRQDIRMIIEE